MNISKRKVVTSAVIVSPPQELWAPIQAIRSKYDKAYQRWMPHINFMYPFVPANEFPAIINPCTEGLANIQPFTLTFDSFDYFQHNPRSCTLFLKPRTEPAGALQQLQSALQKVFPFCDDQTNKSDDGLFHAHLTLGQFKGQREVEKFKSMFEKDWKPIQFEVRHVHIISRSGDLPFEIRHSIPLGQQSRPQPQVPTAQHVPAPSPQARRPQQAVSTTPQRQIRRVNSAERVSRNAPISTAPLQPLPTKKAPEKRVSKTTAKPSPNVQKKKTSLFDEDFGFSTTLSSEPPTASRNSRPGGFSFEDNDFEIRSTVSVDISDDFELPKFQLKKPLTSAKRYPSVKERLAQQKEKQKQESGSVWGSSSSSYSSWDDSSNAEEEERRRREDEEDEERRRQEEEGQAAPSGERPTGPLGIVLDKAEQWIASRNNRDHLPKNKAKLRSSIKPMCQVRAMALEPEEAIEKLKAEGYIEVASNAEKTVTYLKSKEDKQQYRSGQDSAPKEPSVEALKRCKEWVVQPLNAPKTLDALQNCLKQLCNVKYEFDPDRIVKLMEEQQIIRIDLNDKVHYLR